MNKKVVFVVASFLLSNFAFGKTIIFTSNYTFAIAIPNNKDLKDVIATCGNTLYFNQNALIFVLFENEVSGCFQQSITDLHSHLSHTEELVHFVIPGELDSNELMPADFSTYPALSTTDLLILTYIPAGQTINLDDLQINNFHYSPFNPNSEFTDTHSNDDESFIAIPSQESSVTSSDGYISLVESSVSIIPTPRKSARCLYGCKESFKDSRYAYSHHRKVHKKNLDDLKTMIKNGLKCPVCGSSVKNLLELSRHFRKHKQSNYFDFIKDLAR